MDKSKVITVPEALLKRDPERYEKILGDRVRATKQEEKKALGARERKKLESKIEELETRIQEMEEADNLAQEENAKLKTEIEILKKGNDK
jgi:outer membrane murein-binding lipoprotein Lpp